MKNTFLRFLLRWAACSLGFWLSSVFLGSSITFGGGTSVIIISGLVLALVNAIIKPIVVILSLPAILFSLGLFMIIINALMVLLAGRLYDGLTVDGFGTALVAGIVIGLVNYIISAALERE